MSGIPVYTSSPINAAKASSTTPQTALPQSNLASTVATVTATSASISTSSYPPAQPGAPAFPAPTEAAQRYAPPLQPTPTTNPSHGPAAPQPGSVPHPTSNHTPPSPPKAGETYHPPAPSQCPPQMSIPAPTSTSTYRGIPPSSTTSTSTTASVPYPVAVVRIGAEAAAPRSSLEHPPGYHQDIHASELTAAQRRMREANESALHIDEDEAAGVDGAAWDTAKKWAASAREKIQEAEAEVWRRVAKE